MTPEQIKAQEIVEHLKKMYPRESIEAFLREFGERVGKYYWTEGFAENPFDETAITELINKTLGQ